MITEKDLTEAIAYCSGKTDPQPKDAILMAACYILQDHLFPSKDAPLFENAPAYSYAAPPEQIETTIDYYSDTDFSQAIDGRQAADIWPIMDELMTVLQATNPRLYAGVMRKIEN